MCHLKSTRSGLLLKKKNERKKAQLAGETNESRWDEACMQVEWGE